MKEFFIIAFFIVLFPLWLFCQEIEFESVADSWIRTNTICSDWCNTNYGDNIMMQCNAWTYSFLDCGVGINRAMIKFDLNTPLSSNQIYDGRAELLLYFPDVNNQETQNFMGSATDNMLYVNLISENWQENAVTWNNQPDVLPGYSVLVPSTNNIPSFDDYQISVGDLVSFWFCNPEQNYGFKLRLVNEEYYRRVSFSTKEYNNPENHPKLVCHFATIEATGPSSACGNFNLEGEIYNAQNNSDYSFQWEHLNSGTTHNYQDWINPISYIGENIYVFSATNSSCMIAYDTIIVTVGTLDYNLQDMFTICNEDMACIDFGISNVNYLWSTNDSGDSLVLNSSSSGNYSVTISDDFGCSYVHNFTVNFSNFEVDFFTTDVSCYGGSNGYAEVLVNGGFPPFVYNWSQCAHGNESCDNLNAGLYYVTISDSIGCYLIDSVEIFEPLPLIGVTQSTTNQNCAELGSATISVEGGVPPYNYFWPDNVSVTNNGTADQLHSGTYIVTIIDDNACSLFYLVEIGNEDVLDVNIFEVEDFSCSYDENAVLSVNCEDCAEPLTYNWSTASTNDTVVVHQSGMYYVSITDSIGCFGTANYNVLKPDPIVPIPQISDVKCFGENSGDILLDVSGGKPPYIIQWNNDFMGPHLDSLFSGNYSVTITDLNSCTASFEFFVDQPFDSIHANIVISHPLCVENSFGSCIIEPQGGVPPYFANVFNENYYSTGLIHDSLSPGEYSFQIIDANNCSFEHNFNIEYPDSIFVDLISIQNPSCFGKNDGFFEIYVTGGQKPYTFELNGVNSQNSQFNNLYAGEYSVIVRDANNCSYLFDDIYIEDNQDLLCYIIIPNAFTPNGDGINDLWEIDNIEVFSEATIKVFNRWGQELWYGYKNNIKWDGFFNAERLPAGPYLYIIDLNNGNPQYVGIVTIIY